LNATARLKRTDNVTFQKVAGEAILIRLDTGTYFSLNRVGTEFWESLDGQRTIEEHAAALAEKNNRIVKLAVDGLHALAEGISREHEAEAQTLVDDLRDYARAIAQKYLVHTSRVVGDLIELAEKMAADKLVDVA
jgi:hypothetical protein